MFTLEQRLAIAERKAQAFEQAYLGLLERHTKLIDAYIARYGEAIDFFQSSPRCKRPFLSVTTGKNVRAL